MIDNINVMLTTRCNSNCKYCYLSANNNVYDELNFQILKNFLKDFITNNGKKVMFTGGEATLYPNFKEIIEYAKKIKLHTTVFTNGLMFNKDNIDFIKKIDELVISFDGKPEVHDYYRGLTGSHSHTINLFKLLKDNNIDYSIQTTVGDKNINDIEYVANIGTKYGAKSIKFSNIVSEGRAKFNDEFSKKLELKEFFKKLSELQVKFPGIEIKSNIDYLKNIKEKYSGKIIPNIFWLLPNGDIQLYSSVPHKNLIVGNYNNYLDININFAGKYLNNSIKSVLQDNKEFEFINLSQKLEDYFN